MLCVWSVANDDGFTRQLERAGFEAAFSTMRGTLSASSNRYLHPRVMLRHNSAANALVLPFIGWRYDRSLGAMQHALVGAHERTLTPTDLARV